MWKKALVVAPLLAASLAGAQELTPVQQLGKELFFDRISNPVSQSCADCHAEAFGWTGPTAGVGLHGGIYAGAVPQRFGNRKPPTSAYVTFSPPFRFDEATGEFVGGTFWDGRATGERLGSPGADQAIGPFLNPVEQNMASEAAVCAHVAGTRYAALFERVWGPGSLDCSAAGAVATYERIGLSIAEYEASAAVSPFSSRFDAYLRACLAAGNAPEACGRAEGLKATLDPANVLTVREFDGLLEFGEYCNQCHTSVPAVAADGTFAPPLFTDFTFVNLGVPRNPENPFYAMDTVFLDDGQPINPEGAAWVDRGLGGFLRTRPEWAGLAAANDGKFRVPTLRNVDKRAGRTTPKSYMHNAALKSLEEVVHFYNTRDVPAAGWAPPEVAENVSREILSLKPLGDLQLTAAQEASIVAFLKTLTDDARFAPKKK